MTVYWTQTAREHLDAVHAYIARNSEEYALRVVDRITRRTQQIAQFPESGRIVPEIGIEQIREIIEGPYRIVYFIRPSQIDVLAVLHGAQISPWGRNE